MANWGTLSYAAAAPGTVDPPVQTHEINIISIEQQLQLDGVMAQSRRMRHFYPRSHMPGDIVVNGICNSQEEYQQLAYFIRHNQWAILGTPGGNFQRIHSESTNRMLLLDVPTENNQWRGFIKTFGMTKKGVHDPAPTYTFNFMVIFDDLSEDIGISSRVRQYYSGGAQGGGGTGGGGTGGGTSGGGTGSGGGSSGSSYVPPYTTKEKDTPDSIARAFYIHGGRWKVIRDFNPSLGITSATQRLTPGTVLQMPPYDYWG